MINWHEIEDLGEDAERLATLAATIEDAMAYSPVKAQTYLDSLFLLGTLLHQHADKLNSIVKTELAELSRAESPQQAELGHKNTT